MFFGVIDALVFMGIPMISSYKKIMVFVALKCIFRF